MMSVVIEHFNTIVGNMLTLLPFYKLKTLKCGCIKEPSDSEYNSISL